MTSQTHLSATRWGDFERARWEMLLKLQLWTAAATAEQAAAAVAETNRMIDAVTRK